MLSAILACAVLLVGASGVSWEARRVWRGDEAPTRSELAGAAGLQIVVGLGTTVSYLAGWTAVYHEALLWAVAWSVVAFWFLVRWTRADRVWDLVVAATAATFAVLTRGSVGLGAVVAIGIVAGGRAVRAVRRTATWRDVTAPLLGFLVPVVLYAAVNVAKFGSVAGTPPYDLQDRLVALPTRQAALAANHGSLFGVRYAPTILLDYLRPDGLRLDRLFPWVTFPPPAHVVGGAVFESINPSASLTASSPLLVALAIIGVVAVARVRGARRFAVPLVGAALGGVAALSLAFVDQRYQGDFVPLLVVAGSVGAWWLAQGAARLRPGRRAVLVGVAAVLALWSCWVNVGLGYVYARAYAPGTTSSDLAALVATQLRVHDGLGGGVPSRVEHVDALPIAHTAPVGTLAVVGDCDALLWSDGRAWYPVEQTATTGLHRVRMELDPTPASAGERQPVISVVDGAVTTVLWVVPDGDAARLELSWFDQDGEHRLRDDDGSVRSARVVPVGRAVDVDLRLDPQPAFLPGASVAVDGDVVLRGGGPGVGSAAGGSGSTVALGRQPIAGAGASTLNGSVRRRGRAPTPSCDRLLGRG